MTTSVSGAAAAGDRRRSAMYLSGFEVEFGARVPVAELAEFVGARDEVELLLDEGVRYGLVADRPAEVLAAASAVRTLAGTRPLAAVYCCETIGARPPASAATAFAVAAGIPDVPVFTVGGAGCGNLGPGLRVARGLLAAEGPGSVLLAVADRAPGPRYLPGDLTVLSDGAATCLVSTSPARPGFRLLGSAAVTAADRAGARPGLAAAKAAAAGVAAAVGRVLTEADTAVDECALLLVGNYGASVRAMLAAAAGFPSRTVHAPNVADGHCFAVDLLHGLRSLEPSDMDRIVLVATGPHAWTALLLEYRAC
ncbi:hypothetical protein [Actinokineospora enzanensis]|uniref:hypothetical protein n=1 Tax=Actinokineospora enzanensis TaxID=155975 RepID=UPI0012EB9C6A|nr:hypothetical protein [Actinokineospora enzanensis]